MEKEDIIPLLKKYADGQCSPAERSLVEDWYLTYEADGVDELPYKIRQAALVEIEKNIITKQDAKVSYLWLKLTCSAAVVMFVISVGFIFLRTGKPEAGSSPVLAAIRPAGKDAVLQLTGGKTIVLDQVQPGLLAEQGNSLIQKSAEGRLTYSGNRRVPAGEDTSSNTLSTPKGGNYELVLSDGSRVWLNAQSSLRFPTSFHGAERKVFLSGEAYFEIAKNKNMPFRVVSGNQTVEVLGTHFNINAYQDEATINTTLLEGAVRVLSGAGKSTSISPGQQAVNYGRGKHIEVKNVSTDSAVDWKEGEFRFVNEDIGVIMRKLSRWYDVEIIYKGNLKDKVFVGKISRYASIMDVLNMLELTRTVHFKIEGRKVTVME
jgi:transmembrane sensor